MSRPGRPKRHIPSEPFEIQFSAANMLGLRTLFRDPTSSRGIKHGAISAFVDGLVAAYFRHNPVVSSEAIKAALNQENEQSQ